MEKNLESQSGKAGAKASNDPPKNPAEDSTSEGGQASSKAANTSAGADNPTGADKGKGPGSGTYVTMEQLKFILDDNWEKIRLLFDERERTAEPNPFTTPGTPVTGEWAPRTVDDSGLGAGGKGSSGKAAGDRNPRVPPPSANQPYEGAGDQRELPERQLKLVKFDVKLEKFAGGDPEENFRLLALGDGTKGVMTVDVFLGNLQNAFKASGTTSEAAKLHYAFGSLTGEAAAKMALFAGSCKTFDQFSEKLKELFGVHSPELLARKVLKELHKSGYKMPVPKLLNLLDALFEHCEMSSRDKAEHLLNCIKFDLRKQLVGHISLKDLTYDTLRAEILQRDQVSQVLNLLYPQSSPHQKAKVNALKTRSHPWEKLKQELGKDVVEQRLREGKCLRCGKDGHRRAVCPENPKN